MPQMPRDDEEERFDQRREDQVAVQGQRLRRVGDQVVRPRRRGPARRSGLAVLQGQPGGTPHTGRSLRRANTLMWSLWPPVPLDRSAHDVVHLDDIHLHRKAVVLIAIADGHVIG